MKVKWSKKKAIECITELRSPFEEITKPQGGVNIAIAEKIKEMARRNQGAPEETLPQ